MSLSSCFPCLRRFFHQPHYSQTVPTVELPAPSERKQESPPASSDLKLSFLQASANLQAVYTQADQLGLSIKEWEPIISTENLDDISSELVQQTRTITQSVQRTLCSYKKTSPYWPTLRNLSPTEILSHTEKNLLKALQEHKEKTLLPSCYISSTVLQKQLRTVFPSPYTYTSCNSPGAPQAMQLLYHSPDNASLLGILEPHTEPELLAFVQKHILEHCLPTSFLYVQETYHYLENTLASIEKAVLEHPAFEQHGCTLCLVHIDWKTGEVLTATCGNSECMVLRPMIPNPVLIPLSCTRTFSSSLKDQERAALSLQSQHLEGWCSQTQSHHASPIYFPNNKGIPFSRAIGYKYTDDYLDAHMPRAIYAKPKITRLPSLLPNDILLLGSQSVFAAIPPETILSLYNTHSHKLTATHLLQYVQKHHLNIVPTPLSAMVFHIQQYQP